MNHDNVEPNKEDASDYDEFSFLKEETEDKGEMAEDSQVTEQPQVSVSMRYDPIKEIITDRKLILEHTLPFAMTPFSDARSRESGLLAGNEDARALWSKVITAMYEEGFVTEQVVLDEDRMKEGDWHQGLNINNEQFRRPAVFVENIGSKTSDNKAVDSDNAGYLLDEAEGNAGVATVRCFSMGVSFRIRRLPLTKMATLFNRIATDKRVIGINTAGSGYSAESTYLDENLLTLVKSVILDANIEKFKMSMLDEILTDQGLDELLLGIASLMYQKGFDFSRACIKEAEKCTHVDQGLIDILDSIWVDNALMSEQQIKHWTKAEKHKLSDIKEYQAGFVYRYEEEFVSDRVKVTYQEPLLKNKISSGKKWIETIYAGLTEAFFSEPSQNERAMYLNEQMSMAIIGAYVPFIKQIEIFDTNKEESRIVTNQEAIRNSLIARVGQGDGLINKITRGVLKFQAYNRVTVFGTLNYICPSCGTLQSDNHGAFGGVIPYNPRVTFMNLGVRKVKANK